MVSQSSIQPYLKQAYVFGLMMMAVGLTLSPFLMSLSQFWLIVVWIADGYYCHGESSTRGFKQKLLRFWSNKAAVLLVAFYLMHVIGLLYTSDFQYALKDLRVKLPILLLPFILSSMPPLDHKRFDLVMLVYVLSVFVATQFSFFHYLRHDYDDIREISHFISHIRFCLNIVFCITVVGWYIYKKGVSTGSAALKEKTDKVIEPVPELDEGPVRVKHSIPAFGLRTAIDRFLQWFLLFWFIYQIFIFETLSGYVTLAAVVAVSLVYAFLKWKKSKGWRIAVGAIALALCIFGITAVVHIAKPMLKINPVDFDSLEQKTAQGNAYWHDTIHYPVEDGKYVGLYYCKKELLETWPLRSDLPLEDSTLNGENLEATLARYLTSKGLRKDAEGVMALTDEDVHNIEQGVANYNNWKHPGLHARLSSTLFEYNLYRRLNNPNGGSLSQRIEFTRAAFRIIGQHPWFGVGTGDVPQTFAQTYDEIQSPLQEEYRFRAHNQFLTIAVAFGLIGLVFFLVVMFYPWFASQKHRTYLYMTFLCIILLSMLPEDTLETQAGASLFAFFEALLLFAVPNAEPQPSL